MSPKPRQEPVDDSEVQQSLQVSRHDQYVRDQFVWEVSETVELIRSVSMASMHGETSVAQVCGTCVANLLELGKVLELSEFTTAVRELGEVVTYDPFDGALIDKCLDEVLRARWIWPTEVGD